MPLKSSNGCVLGRLPNSVMISPGETGPGMRLAALSTPVREKSYRNGWAALYLNICDRRFQWHGLAVRIGGDSVLDCELYKSWCCLGVDYKEGFEQLTVRQHVLIHADDETPKRTRPD